ncbi:ubiquitin-conjugating enzyme E2 Z [Blastomyces parvus]|uniref:Ubiquitin-conjugating enzyme E2 Z n=1 Tax=Blastomyces parvus TaxID=2060905 RepID=A0A2B7X9U5_9EURO|nr:ubiquitin-conjugating enzyme E2 Z [Blastomyces parvus]
MSNQAILRIGREISQIQNGTDLSLAVYYKESDISSIKALIVGPHGTPYEFGFFEFSIKFPEDYPGTPPTVHSTTTNGGRCRYNPNIYASGKVCLTWRGERGEQWSSAQGLESVLISIQSLMSSNPYENEPGFENARSDHDKKNMAHYAAKIRHETLRIAVVQRLEELLGIQSDGTIVPPCPDGSIEEEEEEDRLTGEDGCPTIEPFEDLLKRRFLWYYESYILAIDAAELEVTPSQTFKKMPFENIGNTMDGRFDYPGLRTRLGVIKETIVKETESWIAGGLKEKEKETRIAVNLQRQHEQIVADLRNKGIFMLVLDLEEGNPFLWNLTYFCKPMTQFDDGIFQIQIYLSPKFPHEQPRVIVKPSLFHNRISKDGVLCYIPKKMEEMKAHIEAIVEALEDEAPPYNPWTTVNPEASKLFWGSEEDKKKYNRLLRRSVQRCTE